MRCGLRTKIPNFPDNWKTVTSLVPKSSLGRRIVCGVDNSRTATVLESRAGAHPSAGSSLTVLAPEALRIDAFEPVKPAPRLPNEVNRKHCPTVCPLPSRITGLKANHRKFELAFRKFLRQDGSGEKGSGHLTETWSSMSNGNVPRFFPQ